MEKIVNEIMEYVDKYYAGDDSIDVKAAEEELKNLTNFLEKISNGKNLAEALEMWWTNINAVDFFVRDNSLLMKIFSKDSHSLSISTLPVISMFTSLLMVISGCKSFDELKGRAKVNCNNWYEFSQKYDVHSDGTKCAITRKVLSKDQVFESIEFNVSGDKLVVTIKYPYVNSLPYESDDLNDINGELNRIRAALDLKTFSELKALPGVTCTDWTKFQTIYQVDKGDVWYIHKRAGYKQKNPGQKGTPQKLTAKSFRSIEFNVRGDDLVVTIVYSDGKPVTLKDLGQINEALSIIFKNEGIYNPTMNKLKMYEGVSCTDWDKYSKNYTSELGPYSIKISKREKTKEENPEPTKGPKKPTKKKTKKGELEVEKIELNADGLYAEATIYFTDGTMTVTDKEEIINRYLTMLGKSTGLDRVQKLVAANKITGNISELYKKYDINGCTISRKELDKKEKKQVKKQEKAEKQAQKEKELQDPNSDRSKSHRRRVILRCIAGLAAFTGLVIGLTSAVNTPKKAMKNNGKSGDGDLNFEMDIDGLKYKGTYGMTDEEAIGYATKKDFVESSPIVVGNNNKGSLTADKLYDGKSQRLFQSQIDEFTTNHLPFNFETMASPNDYSTIKVISDARNDGIAHGEESFANDLAFYARNDTAGVLFNGKEATISFGALDDGDRDMIAAFLKEHYEYISPEYRDAIIELLKAMDVDFTNRAY